MEKSSRSDRAKRKPRLSDYQLRVALRYWRTNKYDTGSLAAMLFVSEAAVYNSLAEFKGQLGDGKTVQAGL